LQSTPIAILLTTVLFYLWSAGIAAAAEGANRDEALGIYFERCEVEPGSTRAGIARADWDHLIGLGWTGVDLLDIASHISEDCDHISFKSAVLATGRELDHPSMRPEHRGEPPEPYVAPARGSKAWSNEIGLQRPFRGLPRQYHGGWVFGMLNAGLAGAGLFEAVAMFFAVGAAGDNLWLAGGFALAAVPGLGCLLIGGAIAAITAAVVESHRVTSPSVIREERRRRRGTTLHLLPGEIVVRF
jgi:hypothetical protein